jgi:hypothetical protein
MTRPIVPWELPAGNTHVAVVGAADGVRMVAVTRSPNALLRRLAEYVERRIDLELPKREARQVRSHLASGELAAAVRVYFSCRTRRWDEEWLHVTTVRDVGASEIALLPRQTHATADGGAE